MDKTIGTVQSEYTNCGMCEMQCSIDEPFSQKINNMKICIKCYKELYIGETKELRPNNKNYSTINWVEMCAHLKSMSEYRDSRNINFQTCSHCSSSPTNANISSNAVVIHPSSDNPYSGTRSKTKSLRDQSITKSLRDQSITNTKNKL